MVIEMTPQELRDYIRFMPDDEILKITIEFKEDSHERDDRERDEAKRSASAWLRYILFIRMSLCLPRQQRWM